MVMHVKMPVYTILNAQINSKIVRGFRIPITISMPFS